MISNRTGMMIVVSSPSGVGKTTLVKLLDKRNKNFEISISHTTRILRKNEIEGKDYYSINEVYYVCTSTLKYLVSIIKGSGDSSQLGGPIRIAKVTGQVAEFGILPFLSMMAYISISLGLINLFPIPLLDGGHLMFYSFEKVLGRPLSQKTQEGFFRIGMFLLLSLMFFATFNDLKDLGLF